MKTLRQKKEEYVNRVRTITPEEKERIQKEEFPIIMGPDVRDDVVPEPITVDAKPMGVDDPVREGLEPTINQKKQIEKEMRARINAEYKLRNEEKLAKSMERSSFKPLTEDSPLKERIAHYTLTGEKIGSLEGSNVSEMNEVELERKARSEGFTDEEVKTLRTDRPRIYAVLISKGLIN